MKKLLVLMLSVGVISQLNVTNLSASSQQQVTQQAQQVAQQAQQAAQKLETAGPAGLYKALQPGLQSVLQSAQAALSQASSAQTLQAAQAALIAAQAAQQQASSLHWQFLLPVAIMNIIEQLYPEVSNTQSLSPLAPATDYSAVVTTAPSGDFLPLSAVAGYNQGQMFVSFLSSNATYLWDQHLIVSLILYTLLDSTSGVTAASLMSAQSVFAGLVNGQSVVPSTPAQITAYLSNSVGLKFTGGAIPAAALNLLINVSKANWSAIYSDSTQIAALVNAFNAINLSSSQFTSVFSGSSLTYGTYYVNAFKASQSGANLYMNCSINPSNGQPSDNVSVYYAVNPSTVTSDLATQFANVQVEYGATTATVVTLNWPGINNMPFSYKTGAFYDVLTILSATDASNIWNSVCSKSSSSVWFNTPQIRQIVSSMMTQNNATTSNLRMLK